MQLLLPVDIDAHCSLMQMLNTPDDLGPRLATVGNILVSADRTRMFDTRSNSQLFQGKIEIGTFPHP